MASIKKRTNGQWRARYRDDAGREHARHFPRKTDAQRWLDEVTTSIVTGQYVDPRAGRVTLRAYAEDWRQAQPHGINTRRRIEKDLRLHVYPAIGDRPIGKIRPSTLQALVSGMPLAPASVENVLSVLTQIFRAAVRDKVIATNPTDGVKLPTGATTREAWIPDPAQIVELRAHLPPHYRAIVDLVVGSGLRQGEVSGLEVDHIDFLRGRAIRVEQQLLSSPVGLGAPKTAESRRVVPLASDTLDALAEHLAAFPPREVEVVDRTDPVRPTTRAARLVFPTATGKATLSSVWSKTWAKAARPAGFPPRSGLHSVRHYYASALIRFGESAKVVQRRLGHGSVEITLRTYTHLWPDSDDRTREAVESALADLADRSRTAPHKRASDLQR